MSQLIVLKFTPKEFERLKTLVNIYPYRTEEPRTSYLQSIRQALNSTKAKATAQFSLTKEEFRFLIIAVDIMSIGARRWDFTFGEAHNFYIRLDKEFARMFKEDAYAKSELPNGKIHVGSNPTTRAN